MDKVCILGIDGFTGSHFLDYIQTHRLAEQYDFFGFSRTPTHVHIPISALSATDRGALSATLKKLQPQYIVNLIGSPQPATLEAAVALNATISQWICEITLEEHLPLKKLLAIGSAAEYGVPESLPITELHPLQPVSMYGLAKAWQTQVLSYFHRKHSLPINVARTFNIIGSGMPNYLSIGSFAEQIRTLGDVGKLLVGNIESKRDFLNINDVIDAYWKILIDAPSGEIYNVCNGSSLSMREILQTMIKASHKNITIHLDQQRVKRHDVPDIYGDNQKLQQATNWKPSGTLTAELTEIVQAS